MNDPKDDEFGALLRRAMTARPEAPIPGGLAARAIARAVRPSFSLSRILSSLAAFLLIGSLFAAAAWRWYLSSASAESTDTATSSLTAAADLSTQNAALFLLGGSVVVAALLLVTLERLFTRDEPMLPAYL